jgi:proteasome accessory factor A
MITEWQDILERWQHVLDTLRNDPMQLADQLDWVAKLQLLESYRQRDGLSWDAAKLSLIDLQYTDVDPRRSLFQALIARGKMRRLVDDDQIQAARLQPPTDTRAYFRGRVMEKFSPAVVAASWDSVILDVPGWPALQRIPLLDPLRGTSAQVKELIDRSETVAELFTALGLGRPGD